MKKQKSLSAESKQLQKEILENFPQPDPAFLAILDAGLRARELLHAAQLRVDAEGLTVTGDRGGMKVHPLLDVVKASRSALFNSFKLLKLDLPPDGDL